MNFTNVVSFLNKAPEGWLDKLNLKQYATLDEERKKYYGLLFATYRTKKIRDYDPEDGAFVGWKPIQIGIGNPIGYKYIGYFAARMVDDVLRSNVLIDRILKPKS